LAFFTLASGVKNWCKNGVKNGVKNGGKKQNFGLKKLLSKMVYKKVKIFMKKKLGIHNCVGRSTARTYVGNYYSKFIQKPRSCCCVNFYNQTAIGTSMQRRAQ